jgi:hypothetical protein
MPLRFIFVLIIVALSICSFGMAQEAPKKKLARADSRMPYVHRISLLDEEGNPISPKDPNAKPYSPKMTCGKCHDYEAVSHGWHFNANEAGAVAGRPGEPWIYTDLTTRTQIPLSYRGWKGTWKPADIGLTDYEFVHEFGRHLPGGAMGENPTTQPAKPTDRWANSGMLQIDCMICHSGDHGHDPGQRDLQIEQSNYRFAPLRGLGAGFVRGSIAQFVEEAQAEAEDESVPVKIDPKQQPKVVYDPNRFNPESMITLNVIRTPPANRCYYCHTNHEVGKDAAPRWFADRDVHLAAGLTCADCHRNGIDHHITRGYEGELVDRQKIYAGKADADIAVKGAATLSCAGCHLGTENAENPNIALGGKLGSPRPLHKGFPPIHFEKLTCTACHAGPWPEQELGQIQTSLAHGLGLESFTRHDQTPPHIAWPVFLRDTREPENAQGKIAPYKLVWPSYWGRLEGEKVTPIGPDVVKKAVKNLLPNVREGSATEWAALSEEQMGKVLGALSGMKGASGEAVFVSAGKMYRLKDGKVSAELHGAAEPYAWSIAHDVRPANQSLGVRGCNDCHSENAPIYFGNVAALGPVNPQAVATRVMHEMRPNTDASRSSPRLLHPAAAQQMAYRNPRVRPVKGA